MENYSRTYFEETFGHKIIVAPEGSGASKVSSVGPLTLPQQTVLNYHFLASLTSTATETTSFKCWACFMCASLTYIFVVPFLFLS